MFRVLLLSMSIVPNAFAQSMHITHISNGLDATSAKIRIERGVTRPYGPKFFASGMNAPSALEYFPGLKMPGQREALARPVSIIRVVKPGYRLPEQDLGIANVHDVVFFAEHRMVRFRFHLQGAGESLEQRWSERLRKYFEFLDRDGNGDLNRFEAEFALATNGVAQLVQSGFAYQRPNDVTQTFIDMDLDGDGRICFDELAAYYTPAASRIISAIGSPIRDTSAESLTAELFKILDTDRDGRLSREELTSIERMFASLDADEDECLTALELVPSLTIGRQVTAQPKTPSTPLTNPMISFRPGAAPENLPGTILARYDGDKNGRISKKENPFTDETFARLDKNGDGDLSVTELAVNGNAPPDLELDMRIADKQEKSVVRLRDGAKQSALAASFRASGDGGAIFTIGNQVVQLGAYAPRGIYNQPGRANPISFPDRGKGFVLEGDIAGPQFQAMRIMFDMIDRDADAKISRAEYDAFFALQQSFTSLPMTLVYSAQTPSLFQFLDTNADGRLSMREVRTSWDRLIALEPASKTHVTRAALMPQGAIRFGRSSEVSTFNTAAIYTQQPVRQPGRGPIWFQKFDRNGDGEISRNEFPGAATDFDKLDADRDGYLSLEEAVKADKELRAKK